MECIHSTLARNSCLTKRAARRQLRDLCGIRPRPVPDYYYYHHHRRRHLSSDSSPGSNPVPGPTSQRLPLAGIKVLDLSRVLAGPFCTQLLADYGASVIKIEQPGVGDETRVWRTHHEAQKWKPDHPLMSLYFASINRNKRSVTVDLKSARGREIVLALATRSDVLVHNFLPGKMEALGLGYGTLAARNPGLVYAGVSGYGATGPAAARAGYDAIALAEAGLLHITGQRAGGPAKPGVAIADICTGLYVHGAVLAALNARGDTGRGMQIDGSLFESSLSLLINVGLASLNLDLECGAGGRRRGERLGLEHPTLVPYGGFETRDGGYVFIAANNNRQWRGFCGKMGIEGLEDDERFSTNDGRVRHRGEIVRRLQDRFRQKTKEEWMRVFDGSGLPYGAINDVVEALEHPQSRARDMVVEIDEVEAARDGVLKLIGPAIKFAGVETGIRRNPPLLGEHTDEVLRELGYGSAEISKLRDARIV